MLTTAQLKGDLAQYYGGEGVIYHHSLVKSFRYSPGVRYFAQRAGRSGAYWLLDVLATEFMQLNRSESFILITFDVTEKGAGSIVASSHDAHLKKKDGFQTDVQPGKWQFYLQAIDQRSSVLILPSEY